MLTLQCSRGRKGLGNCSTCLSILSQTAGVPRPSPAHGGGRNGGPGPEAERDQVRITEYVVVERCFFSLLLMRPVYSLFSLAGPGDTPFPLLRYFPPTDKNHTAVGVQNHTFYDVGTPYVVCAE